METATVSSLFNKEDADVILISNDHISFHAHKRNLSYNSQFFADLFELGGKTETGRPEIKLDETAATLEIGLRYCYPGAKSHLVIGVIKDNTMFQLIKFFDKYQIFEGLDAIRESFFFELGKSTGDSSYRVFACLFSKKCGYDSLFKRAMQQLYCNTTPAELQHLKKKIFDEYRDEASYIGFLLSSRMLEFSLLKQKKLQSLARNQFPLSNLEQLKSSILEFDLNADYINLQNPEPRGLLSALAPIDIKVWYDNAMAELREETKALKMEF